MVCRGLQVSRAHQALQDTKASQDVMENTARKDQWDSQGHRGHLEVLGHLETKVYLDLQADEGLWVLRVPEVSLGPQQTWMPAPESQGFLGYQAREDRKEPWGFLA